MRQYAETGWTAITLDDERDYISGTSALNLEDPRSGDVADWHQSGWHGPKAENGTATHAATMNIAEGLEVWGRYGLHDGREALAKVGHPCGQADQPVPVASHERVITDLALHYTHFGIDPKQAVGADQINRWLGTFRAWITLQVQASRIGRRLSGAERKTWYEWQKTLHPCRRWDTEHTAWWPLGYRP